MTTAARQRTPVTDALRAIQGPVRDRLEFVVDEMHAIVSSDLPMIEQVSAHLLRMRTTVANELTIGEMRQLAAVDGLEFSEDDYFALIRSKTAVLLSAACETGALCGAARYRSALARYGERLGMAFQIADDILDYTSDSAVTGKPSGLDLREHKVTLPLIVARPELTAQGRRRVG